MKDQAAKRKTTLIWLKKDPAGISVLDALTRFREVEELKRQLHSKIDALSISETLAFLAAPSAPDGSLGTSSSSNQNQTDTLLSQTPRASLQTACERVLLDLRHRWLPTSGKERSALRRRVGAGLRINQKAQKWLPLVALKIVQELTPQNLTAFLEDPTDSACLSAAMIYLALRGGLNAEHSAADGITAALGEMAGLADRGGKLDRAKSGGAASRRAKQKSPFADIVEQGVLQNRTKTPKEIAKAIKPKLTKRGWNDTDENLRGLIRRARSRLAVI